MKLRLLLPILFCSSLGAQTQQPASPAPVFKPDTLIATINGDRKVTYGELIGYLDALGPEKKAAALSQPQQLIQQYASSLKLVELAEKEKLDQTSPYKEALEISRRDILSQAEFNYQSLHLIVTADEQKKYYDDHKDKYTEVKLQEIYLPFTSDEVAKENPKKYRNEEQTKTLAMQIQSQAKTNADFVRLVKQYSEDEASKAKDGQFGTLKMADNVPPSIKEAVFALKEGEVSAPIQQQNGYYIFRAQSVGLRPYSEVKDEIYTELKTVAVRKWFEDLQKDHQHQT